MVVKRHRAPWSNRQKIRFKKITKSFLKKAIKYFLVLVIRILHKSL